MQVGSLCREDPLEEETAIRSRILAWEIPWTEEPGGLCSMGLRRVGHDRTTKQQRWLIRFTVQQGESVLRAHTLSFPCRSLRGAGEGPCAMHLFSHCCARLFFVPMDCSPPGSSVHGISQATVLE